MSVAHQCDRISRHDAEVCYCQGCFDDAIKDAREEGYKEGYDKGCEDTKDEQEETATQV